MITTGTMLLIFFIFILRNCIFPLFWMRESINIYPKLLLILNVSDMTGSEHLITDFGRFVLSSTKRVVIGAEPRYAL